ncbi:FGGY-family carbohydrate kinase [Pseudanabaena mucicola]|uniref:FGGY-family carbohydrate kinase n=1 Tax=Pseudanabaena mucicola FACHB-723 TaxID=2692860 RepID=A0ABR8A1M1_9CYAN|nr:FGGY-family carbohydrate kinase [Pseudanabaena mucicola]MBD2189645.1 FGGY-family carbohydrate kinase [Pseudanabaena mucicola FACHB-723]
MDHFLGIDFGTSGVRAIAINCDRKIIDMTRADYDIRDCQTWQFALQDVISQLSLEIRQNIKSIAIDGTSATVVLCDRNGTVMKPPMIYSDICAAELLDQVNQIAPPQHIVCSATSSFAKLIAIAQDIKPATETDQKLYLLHQADYLGYLLHGNLGISDYHNALKLGYDPILLTYPDWLQNWAAQNPAVTLPKVLAPSTPVGMIQPEIAHKLDLPKDCMIVAGTTDSNAAFLASVGCAAPAIGTAVTSLGSTMVLKVLSDRPINDSRYGIYSHRFEHPQHGCLWLVGGASNVGGAVLRQFFSDQQLSELCDRINPEIPSPLDYYPLPKTGDRFPINDPHLTPRLEPRPNDPAEFLHGLLESMARIEAQGYALLRDLGASPVQQLYTAGGGANNPVWTKIRNRNLQIPMAKSSQMEAAYGAALLALN